MIRCFITRNLEEKIEHFVPGTDLSVIKDTLLLSKNYITRLHIKQLLPPVREAPKPFQLDDDDAASDAGFFLTMLRLTVDCIGYQINKICEVFTNF